jgi:hypothetical protein
MLNNQVAKIVNPIDQVKAFVERDSYGFVNTREVLDIFGQAGWSPVSESYGKVKKEEKKGYQKHLIRLENPAFPAIEGLTDANKSRPQLVVLNSHDGSSSLQIMWGLIRIACLNGIIAGTGINGVRIVHSKSIVDKLPSGIDYMLNNFGKFNSQIKELQGKQLSAAATKELIKIVYDERLKGVSNLTQVNYDLIRSRRIEDNASDAYTIFNRVQEALMRGGIQYQYLKQFKDDNGAVIGSKLITTHTGKISAVTSQVKLNQLAYDTALNLAA